jgi:MFS transporter, AAHS family, 4-hydroxybenzoate transporter
VRSREDVATPAGVGLDRAALLLIAICSLTYFLDGLIPVLMGPLAGPIAGSLGLSRPELGAVFSANLVGQCAGLLTIPLLARRFGHRAVILWTTLGFGVSQGLTAFVWDRDTLVLSRLVTGVFLGGALPSCLAAVTQVAPAARRGLATMLLFTAYGLGGAVAGFLASLFVEGGDWRQAFGVTGVACLVVVAIGWRWLEDVPAGPGADGRLEGRSPRLLDIVTPPLLGPTLLLWLLFICALTIYYCLSSWLPTLLVDIGRSPTLAAYAVGSYTGGGVVAGLLVGPLIDRFGAVRVLGLFITVAAVLLFAIGQAMATVSDAVLLAMLATCGFFMLGAYGGINVVLAACYPPSLRAVGVGWTKSVSRLGTVLPPVAIGYAMSAGVDAGNLVSLSAVPAILMLGALLLIRVPRFR